jgi:hypothetical protein
MTSLDLSELIGQIEGQIADIKARLPRHTPPASMLVELDELEDELRRLQGEPPACGAPHG